MADWRIENAIWTRGAALRFTQYVRPREDWDHDHCAGCSAKFMESGPPDEALALIRHKCFLYRFGKLSAQQKALGGGSRCISD